MKFGCIVPLVDNSVTQILLGSRDVSVLMIMVCRLRKSVLNNPVCRNMYTSF